MIIALLAACGGPTSATIEVAGVKATVPTETVSLGGAAKEQLTAGTTRHDPDADVAVEAVASKDAPDKLLYAVMRLHRSPGMDGGMTVEEWTKANVQALEEHGRSSRIEVSHDVTCANEVCVFEYTMGGGAVYHRSQLSDEDGRLLTLSCQCTTKGCLDACSIPAP